MKIIMVEMNADEMQANKRVADVVIDALTTICDAFVRIPANIKEDAET